MKTQAKDEPKPRKSDKRQPDRAKLTVEELEARIAPALVSEKKPPSPGPYPPGTRYGLIRRDNLRR